MIRCLRILYVYDGFYYCYLRSDDMFYGNVCRFGCYDGYSLLGGKLEVICIKLGKWFGVLFKC